MHARIVALSLVALVSIAGPTLAAPPWTKLELFKKLEADPNKSYPLTEQCGPWSIMAVTFSGPEAEEQAHELVYEIRKRYKLAAYTHAMHFDHSAGSAGQKSPGVGSKKIRYRVNEMNEIAVLVGDFPLIDDPAARKVLEKIKYAHPDCLDVEKRLAEGKSDSRSLGRLRMIQQSVMPDTAKKKHKGPMSHAFITANPLLPDEYFVPKGVDKLVQEMNGPVEFSLLKCPGKYSVKVATFKGQMVIDPKQIEEIEKGKKFESTLGDAADKAHRVTLALRQKGYEAYEFHDRFASIVTVGAFTSVGTPRADGKIEINPQAHSIMQALGPQPSKPGTGAPQGPQPMIIDRIPLDVQPMLVEVPKESLGAQFERPSLGDKF